MAISMERSADRITVSITGEIEAQQLIATLDDVAVLARDEQIDLILVLIDDAARPLGTWDRHQLGLHASQVLPRTVRMAVVAPDQIDAMFETTARERGVHVHVTDDVEEAQAWLTAD